MQPLIANREVNIFCDVTQVDKAPVAKEKVKT